MTTMYSVEEILRQNVADLERELQRQRERAEAAEAELKAAREQEPVAWMHDKEGRVDTCHDSVKKLWLKVGQKQNTQFMREIVPCRVEHYNIPLYTRPIPAPAVPVGDGWFYPDGAEAIRTSAPGVPEDWREVMAELAADLQAYIDAEHAYRDQYSSIMRKYQNDIRIVERARALLQSDMTDHTDCINLTPDVPAPEFRTSTKNSGV